MKSLKETSTLPPEGYTKEECTSDLEQIKDDLFELQNKFYADGRFALLIVLQGVDSSGKDGTVRHVMNSMNPMGIDVKAFKKPTEEELKHDFLWRVYPHFPAKGMIQVFNRSYYEDVIVPEILGSLPPERIEYRIDLINRLEEHLIRNDIHVLKVFLHISKEEQIERIQERLVIPRKKWKYTDEDIIAANKWEAYNDLYDRLIAKTNNVPWHIIPADKRWYRNYTFGVILRDCLTKMDLRYPGTSSA